MSLRPTPVNPHRISDERDIKGLVAMSRTDTAQESSMEEILASIRRIISEDVGAAPPPEAFRPEPVRKPMAASAPAMRAPEYAPPPMRQPQAELPPPPASMRAAAHMRPTGELATEEDDILDLGANYSALTRTPLAPSAPAPMRVAEPMRNVRQAAPRPAAPMAPPAARLTRGVPQPEPELALAEEPAAPIVPDMAVLVAAAPYIDDELIGSDSPAPATFEPAAFEPAAVVVEAIDVVSDEPAPAPAAVEMAAFMHEPAAPPAVDPVAIAAAVPVPAEAAAHVEPAYAAAVHVAPLPAEPVEVAIAATPVHEPPQSELAPETAASLALAVAAVEPPAPVVQPPTVQAMPVQAEVAASVVLPTVAISAARTMEDTVAEMLRPMLREWLDANMPRIVEKALTRGS